MKTHNSFSKEKLMMLLGMLLVPLRLVSEEKVVAGYVYKAGKFSYQSRLSKLSILVGEPIEILCVERNAATESKGRPSSFWLTASAQVVEFKGIAPNRIPIVPELKDDVRSPTAFSFDTVASRSIPSGEFSLLRLHLLLKRISETNSATELRFNEPGLYAIRFHDPDRIPDLVSRWICVGPSIHFLEVKPVPVEEKLAWEFYRQEEILNFVQGNSLEEDPTSRIPESIQKAFQEMQTRFPKSLYTKFFQDVLDEARARVTASEQARTPSRLPDALELLEKELETQHYDRQAVINAHSEEYMEMVILPKGEYNDQLDKKGLTLDDSAIFEAKLTRIFIQKYGKKLEGKAWENYLQRKQANEKREKEQEKKNRPSPEEIEKMRQVGKENAEKYQEQLRRLLVEREKVEQNTIDPKATIHGLIRDGSLAKVKMFLEKNDKLINVKEDNLYGATPLHIAAAYGNLEIVKILLSHGSDINAKQHLFGWTPLHEAAERGHASVVELLLQNQVDPNTGDIDNWTPLHVAAALGHLSVVEILLKHKANLLAKTQEGKDALQIAEELGNKEISNLIRNGLEKGAVLKSKGSTISH